MNSILILLVLSIIAVAFASYPEPPPTFEASKWTTWERKTVAGSRRGAINVQFSDASGNPDFIKMTRLDLIGDATQRGFAHGALLAADIEKFVGPELNAYFRAEVDSLDISTLPPKVQKAIEPLLKAAKLFAPEIFHKAMRAVYESEEQFISQALKDEMSGMAQGMCSTLGSKCDVDEWTKTIQELNMLPELIRMSCTAYGAWGKAVSPAMNGNLLQLRALDFGTGPFAANTIIQVHRSDPNNPNNAFVSVAFPGFVGAITGVSQSGIGISEKVWMVYGPSSLQPGNYHGVPDPLVLRNILEFSKTKEDAVSYLQSIPRTWAMWIGVGDYHSQEFNLVAYSENSAIPYNDQTMTTMNCQPIIEQIAYVDKHPQPSGEGVNGTLPTALKFFHGQVDAFTTKQIIQAHETGDVHAASYDFGNKEMHLTIGRTNADGQFCDDACADDSMWKAYNRPWTKFVLEDLWTGK